MVYVRCRLLNKMKKVLRESEVLFRQFTQIGGRDSLNLFLINERLGRLHQAHTVPNQSKRL